MLHDHFVNAKGNVILKNMSPLPVEFGVIASTLLVWSLVREKYIPKLLRNERINLVEASDHKSQGWKLTGAWPAECIHVLSPGGIRRVEGVVVAHHKR
jgi:hypothetical protein